MAVVLLAGIAPEINHLFIFNGQNKSSILHIRLNVKYFSIPYQYTSTMKNFIVIFLDHDKLIHA